MLHFKSPTNLKHSPLLTNGQLQPGGYRLTAGHTSMLRP